MFVYDNTVFRIIDMYPIFYVDTIASKSTETLLKAINEYCGIFGCPKEFVMDSETAMY